MRAHRTYAATRFTTQTGQVIELRPADDPWLPPAVENGPTVREIVWGVDSCAALDELAAELASDRDVTAADGEVHAVDETGFAVGLAVSAPRARNGDYPGLNRTGAEARWNQPVQHPGAGPPAREWQRSDRTFWRCKNSDTFKPMGPYLVTGADPLSATTTVRVDGEVKASFPTGDMLFDPYDFITAMSRYITLSPGDVVWMGTHETAHVVPGQVVEISIDGLGTLANWETPDLFNDALRKFLAEVYAG